MPPAGRIATFDNDRELQPYWCPWHPPPADRKSSRTMSPSVWRLVAKRYRGPLLTLGSAPGARPAHRLVNSSSASASLRRECELHRHCVNMSR